MKLSPYESMCRVIARFQAALSELGYETSVAQIERWATVVVEAMSGPARFYHSPEHILDVAEGADAIGILAALFHDIVYYQVDGGLPGCLQSVLAGYYEVKDGALYLAQGEASEDKQFRMVQSVFGYGPGQRLVATDGQNEFLSALVAIKELSVLLRPEHLVMIAVCIEATIPFKGSNARMLDLRRRFEAVIAELRLDLQDSEIDAALERAVNIGNKDVANFAFEDVHLFLENTWKVLPETNTRLTGVNIYSIGEYRNALEKMDSFLRRLKPDMIYYRYKNAPSESGFALLSQRCASNLQVALSYIGVKLYAATVLEAIALESGGDVPLAYFVGSLQHGSSNERRIEKFLPKGGGLDQKPSTDRSLVSLLQSELSEEMSFDREVGPVSLFLYECLGESALQSYAKGASQYAKGSARGAEFLRKQDKNAMTTLINACAQMALPRRNDILKLNALF